MNKYAKSLIILLAFATFGCNFQPKYYPPCVDVPEAWTIETNSKGDIANIRWWEQFNDPTLDELIYTALQNNQNLQIATSRVWEFYWRYQLQRSSLYPQIDAEASAVRQRVPLSIQPLPSFNPITNIFTIDLSLSYEADVWGRLRNLTEAALDDFLASSEARKTVILTLISSVANAYVVLRQYDKQLEVGELTLKSRQESYELALLRFLGGLTSEMEVKQAESEVENALIEIKKLEILIPQQENLLSVLIGQNPGPICRGNSIDHLILPFDVPVGLPSCVLLQRPDIEQAEDLLLATNARIGAARAEYFPQINLTGLYGYESTELSTLFSSASRLWRIGASAVQTVFDGGRITSRVQITQTQKEEALHNYILTIQTAFQEVEDALIAHKKSREILIEAQKLVKVLLDYLHLARLQYENGQTDYLNVLDAERKLFTAELDLAQAQGETFVSLIDLYKALGGGWVIDADKYLIKCN